MLIDAIKLPIGDRRARSQPIVDGDRSQTPFELILPPPHCRQRRPPRESHEQGGRGGISHRSRELRKPRPRLVCDRTVPPPPSRLRLLPMMRKHNTAAGIEQLTEDSRKITTPRCSRSKRRRESPGSRYQLIGTNYLNKAVKWKYSRTQEIV